MSNIWQVPHCPTFDSRVKRSDFVCAHSGWALSMCTIWMNFVCTSLMEGLYLNYHCGASRLDTECSLREQR